MALKEGKTLSELSSEFGVHANQIVRWKRELLACAGEIFEKESARQTQDAEARETELYRQIGQLKVELDWMKKNLALTSDDKRKLIEPGNPEISLRRQCELLGLNRSGIYYRLHEGSTENRFLMRLIDEIYTRSPFYGARKIAAELQRMKLGFAVDRKRVGRLT